MWPPSRLLLPITFVVIMVLFFVTLSYREVVMVYTQAGGSYVVARENFGVKVAQIAAVALIIDYIVTVAVQIAAGTDAADIRLPGPCSRPATVEISMASSPSCPTATCAASERRAGLRPADLPLHHRHRLSRRHRSRPRRPRPAARPRHSPPPGIVPARPPR